MTSLNDSTGAVSPTLRKAPSEPRIGGTPTATAIGVRPQMLMGMTQLARVICRMHDLTERDPVFNRVKYLVKFDFPRRYETTRNSPTQLNLEEALKDAFAFELFNFGSINNFVMAAVDEVWPDARRHLLAAWSAGAGASSSYLLIAGNALQREGAKDTGRVLELAGADAAGLPDALTAIQRRRSSVLLLDITGFIRRFREAIGEELIATAGTLESEFEVFAAETFGTSDPSGWKLAGESA